MDRERLEDLISRGLSIREMAGELGVSYTKVRYWLNKYCLQTQWSASLGQSETRECVLCQRQFKTARRRRCNSCNTKVRRVRNKIAAIQLLGGGCGGCGLRSTTENISAFEFHHQDGQEKDFSIGSVANKSWNSIRSELEKCELLCSNCHRLRHSDRSQEPVLEEALNYSGTNQELKKLLERFFV